MPPRSLTPNDARTLLSTLPKSTPLALCIRPNRPTDLTLAALLSQLNTPLHILTPPSPHPLLHHLTQNPTTQLHTIPTPTPTNLRPFAHWAVANSIQHLLLGDTAVDRATSALSSIDGGLENSFVGGPSSGIEMLPTDTLHLLRPLETTPLDLIDATTLHFAQHHKTIPLGLTESQRAVSELGRDISIEQAIRHGGRRQAVIASLRTHSDELIRGSVVEASHWGYIVARRRGLAEAFHGDAGGKLAAMHALGRMALHVSGSGVGKSVDEEQLGRLAEGVLGRERDGELGELPKGRTVGGMVVRKATGRFARRIGQMARWRGGEVREDLMIFTREPDNESGGLGSRRLGGNFGCVAVREGGVYWDNRFVILGEKVEKLGEEGPVVSGREVLLAALKDSEEEERKGRLREAELYVRQIRRVDWQGITGCGDGGARVRKFDIPFECIRALPAVFEKKVGENKAGCLIASPHLGLSARQDLYFMAVRVPRFRCLPAEIDPGFTLFQQT